MSRHTHLDTYVRTHLPLDITWDGLLADGIQIAENIDNLYEFDWSQDEIRAAALLYTDGFEAGIQILFDMIISDFFADGYSDWDRSSAETGIPTRPVPASPMPPGTSILDEAEYDPEFPPSWL